MFYNVSSDIGDIYFCLKGDVLTKYESLDSRERGVLNEMLGLVLVSVLDTLSSAKRDSNTPP